MTTHHSEHIDSLLVKTILGEASPSDQAAVTRWLEQSEDNRHYFDQFKAIWDKSRTIGNDRPVDENLAWERFKKRTQPDLEQDQPAIKVNWGSYAKIAAAILVFLGIGAIFYLNNQPQVSSVEVFASAAKSEHKKLDDGSDIYLNKNSSLTYSPTISKDPVRKVSLEGEAFFKVASDSKRPFVIGVNNIEVKVLGTSFNVRSFDDRTEIIVATGKVEITGGAKSVILLPNQSLVVPKNGAEWTQSIQEDDLYNYYVQNKIVATRLPLQKAVNLLAEYYDTPIQLDKTRAAETISTTFDLNKSLKENLEMINTTMQTRYEEKNGTIVLK